MTIRHAGITHAPDTVLGYRKDGRPIFTIAGGSGEGEAGGESGGDNAATASEQQSEQKTETGNATAENGERSDVDSAKTFDEAYVKQLRDEAAGHRVKGQKAQGVLDEIAKILNPDSGDKADPAELPKQLAQSQLRATNAEREVAIYKAASKNGADPEKLTDSRAFMSKVEGLDPSDKDFASQIATAIKDAVKDNSHLASAQVATDASSADHAGGSGEDNTLDAQIEAAEKAGNHSLAIRLKRQKAYSH